MVKKQPKASITLVSLENLGNVKDISIAFVYFLPNSNSQIYESGLEFIFHNAKRNLILMGDFNKEESKLTKKVQTELAKRKMKQLIKVPTHILGNALDQCWTNIDDNQIIYAGILPSLTKSDHNPILLKLKQNENE